MTTTMHNDTHVKYIRRGFTLMEILIAVMIVGLLGAMIGPALFKVYKNQQVNATKASLRSIKDGISLFKMHTGQYPVKSKDLVVKPKSGEERVIKKWEGPYVGKEGSTDLPEDPWGEKYYYKATPNAKHPYELYSYGPEGKGGPKEDRISVWDLD